MTTPQFSSLLCFCFGGLIAFAQSPAPLRIAPRAEIDQRIPELMAQANIPGLSLASAWYTSPIAPPA